MTGEGGTRFRLRMALHSLDKAHEQAAIGSWREAAMFARGAVELAAKSIAAGFFAVPKTHDPEPLVRAALSDGRFPASLRADATALLPVLARHGIAEYLSLSYGDEEKLVAPWELVTEERARAAVADAERTVALAERVAAEMFGQTG